MQETPGLISGSESSPGEGIGYPLQYSWASLVALMVENPPAVRETWVRSLGWGDLLEAGMATNSSILAWRIPWTEEPGGLQSMGFQRVRHNWVIKHTHICKLVGVTQHIKLKNKNYVNLNRCKKGFDKIQRPFVIKKNKKLKKRE